MKAVEIKKTVLEVYAGLESVLSMYEATEGFQTVCNGVDVMDLVLERISRIKSRVALLGKGAAGTGGYGGMQILSEDHTQMESADELLQVIEETEYFVRQCEVPGVVTRWKRINPKLIYFDCAFEIMESCPEEYLEMKRGLSDVRLSCYPDEELVAERKEYFARKKEQCRRQNRVYSEEHAFQEELLDTLKLLGGGSGIFRTGVVSSLGSVWILGSEKRRKLG